MDQLERILIRQLKKGGMDVSLIPSFIRSLAKTILIDPQIDLLQLNKRLHYLGWDGFELDYHTMQLAMACFEATGIENLGKRPVHWFETHFGSQPSYSETAF